MDFQLTIFLTLITAFVSSHNVGITAESVASPGQIKYAEEQNYDDTGPGSKGSESAYAVYNNPEQAQLSYSDYSFDGKSQYDGFTPSPLVQTTPRFWSHLSEEEYESQNSFTPISNAVQSPVPKFYTNTQTISENPNIPSYYKMRPNLPYTSVVPYQLARQSQQQGSYGQRQLPYNYERVPFSGAAHYRQLSNGGQFSVSPAIYAMKQQQQQGFQTNHGSYPAMQLGNYQRLNNFLPNQHRFGGRTPTAYQGNQLSRSYRISIPRYSEFE